jgi:hypothetical protein
VISISAIPPFNEVGSPSKGCVAQPGITISRITKQAQATVHNVLSLMPTKIFMTALTMNKQAKGIKHINVEQCPWECV